MSGVAPESSTLPREASRHELSLLRFPEPGTAWVILMRATLDAPPPDLDERLAQLAAHVPLVGARLTGETWIPAEPTSPFVVSGDPLLADVTSRPFDLSGESPLRLVVGDGHRLAIAAHHAAFDGLAMVALLDFLLGGPPPTAVSSPAAGPPDGMAPYLRRLARPAAPVARSATTPGREALASRAVSVRGRRVTGRIAASCVAACAAHNRRRGAPFSPIGITVSIGGPAGVGNVAGYRRIDLTPSDPVVEAVVEAMATPQEPSLQARSSRYLKLTRPLVHRMGDSVLVSNLGRQRVTGVRSLDFFPVARGRSAVVFGSATVEGGDTTLSLRAKYLTQEDAETILDDAADRFEASA